MDLRAEKLQLIQQILQINDATLISSVKNLLSYGLNKGESVTDFWNELNEEQQKMISLSIEQLDNGEGIEHKKVMSEFRKKYQK